MRQVVLRAYSKGQPRAEDFALETVAIPTPAEGEVLLRTLWLSLDPLIRFALDDKLITGRVSVRIGEPIYGGTVSQVVQSKHADYAVGDFVEGRSGWREYAAVNPAAIPLRKVDASIAPLSTALGALGMPGQTAHACMVGIGRVAAGETVVISAAAGAVGSLAGQIGRILGARVVGIAVVRPSARRSRRSASMPASTTRRPITQRAWPRPARAASTSTSRTSAEP